MDFRNLNGSGRPRSNSLTLSDVLEEIESDVVNKSQKSLVECESLTVSYALQQIDSDIVSPTKSSVVSESDSFTLDYPIKSPDQLSPNPIDFCESFTVSYALQQIESNVLTTQEDGNSLSESSYTDSLEEEEPILSPRIRLLKEADLPKTAKSSASRKKKKRSKLPVPKKKMAATLKNLAESAPLDHPEINDQPPAPGSVGADSLEDDISKVQIDLVPADDPDNSTGDNKTEKTKSSSGSRAASEDAFPVDVSKESKCPVLAKRNSKENVVTNDGPKLNKSHSTDRPPTKSSGKPSLSRRETIDIGETKHCAGKGSRINLFVNSFDNSLSSLSHKDTKTSRKRIEKAHNDHNESDKNPLDYLTPYQRKEHAIKELKKEIKGLNKQLEEKDAEIEELKSGLDKEIQELLEAKEARIKEVKLKLEETETNYEDLQKSYQESVKTVNSLEATINDLKESIEKQNQRNEALYLEMYLKGQNAARYEREEEIEQMAMKANDKLNKKSSANTPEQVNVKELLAKLSRTQEELAKWQSLRREEAYQEPDKPETEAEATLRFLRDSFFHYITDTKGQDDHMRAMIQIFNFTEVQKKKITKSLLDRKAKAK